MKNINKHTEHYQTIISISINFGTKTIKFNQNDFYRLFIGCQMFFHRLINGLEKGLGLNILVNT